MQKKNNKDVIALIIVLVLAAAALVICQINKPETQQGGKEITVNVDHLNGDDTTFTIHTDEEYLRGALEQEDLIEGTESEYGLYVLTVDGETADESEQQWWGYSVNGTFAELGVLLNIMLTGKHPSREMAAGKMGRIVRKCTMTAPEQRYQSARALMEVL